MNILQLCGISECFQNKKLEEEVFTAIWVMVAGTRAAGITVVINSQIPNIFEELRQQGFLTALMSYVREREEKKYDTKNFGLSNRKDRGAMN